MPCKRLLSVAMAAAIALSALSSTPARAGNDTAKIIAGAAALGIIAAAVAEANDNDHGYVTRHGNQYRHKGYHKRHYRHIQQKRYKRHHYGHAYRKGYRDGYHDGRRTRHNGYYSHAGGRR
jgi:hypothetical protein